MSEKIDIEFSIDESHIPFQVLIKLLSVVLLSLSFSGLFAQVGTNESICDTTAFGHHFNRCILDSAGQNVGLGTRNERGQRDGFWSEGSGTVLAEGNYHKDHRVGLWTIGGSEVWKYDRKGKFLEKMILKGTPVF